MLQFRRFGVPDGDADAIPALDAAGREAVSAARRRLSALLETDPRLDYLDQLGDSEAHSLLLEVVRLCVEGRLHHFLNDTAIPYPVYNFFAGFEENSVAPWDVEERGAVGQQAARWSLMGLPVRAPIGVPASGLTANSRWVRYFASHGFNVVTYKTVRSRELRPHRYPHWVFLEDGTPWSSVEDVSRVRGDLHTWPKDLDRFSTANSFGVPSPAPHVWQADVERTLESLDDGQLLIVSVIGTAEIFTGRDLVDDFVKVAQAAESCGAQAVELNLSCPNTVRSDGPGMSEVICGSPEVTEEIVLAVRESLRSGTKLVAKLGYLEPDLLRQVVSRIGGAVDGISGINTVQAEIVRTDQDTSPFVGTAEEPGRVRDRAGVSGARIRLLGQDFVRRLRALRSELGFTYSILGMGGVVTPADADEYRQHGADAVQSATGACLHPELPKQLASQSPWWADGPPAQPSEQAPRRPLARIGRVLASGGLSVVFDDPDGGGRAAS